MTYTGLVVFFFNDTATTEIYTLSLHDALPIFHRLVRSAAAERPSRVAAYFHVTYGRPVRCRCNHGTSGSTGTSACSTSRSEEHTSELQSRQYLVCRLLLEKKKKNTQLFHSRNH